MTKKLALQWLPCQAPGVIGSVLALVGPVSVYCDSSLSCSSLPYRLSGPVVKASASRAEGPGFESRLRRDFFGVESYQ